MKFSRKQPRAASGESLATVEAAMIYDRERIKAIETDAFFPCIPFHFLDSVIDGRQEYHTCYVIRHRDRCVGFALALEVGRSCQVQAIAIDSEYRRRGFGRAMLHFLTCNRAWYTHSAAVPETEPHAQLFFKSCGWKCISGLRRAYPNGDSALIFQMPSNRAEPFGWRGYADCSSPRMITRSTVRTLEAINR